jgi:AraC-like DNA-binding protein
MELVLVIAGRGLHTFAETTRTIAAGDIFAVDRRWSHRYPDPKGLRVLNVLFDEAILAGAAPELFALGGYQAFFHVEPGLREAAGPSRGLGLTDGPGSTGGFALTGDDFSRLVQRFREIESELRRRADGCSAKCLGLFITAVVDISRAYGGSGSADSQMLLSVGRAVALLKTSYAQAWTLGTLAEEAHLSVPTLVRRFGAAFGLSPMRYLTELRLSASRDRLRQRTDLSITEIAYACGFQDPNNFSRLFKRRFGLSPREWRGSEGASQDASH